MDSRNVACGSEKMLVGPRIERVALALPFGVQTQRKIGSADRCSGGSMFRFRTAIVLLLVVPAVARAEEPRRVLIVDTVTFGPALERSGARQKMVSAVTDALALHGWQGMLADACRDLTCVGPAAAAARAHHALILTGSYGAGSEDLYATDVGVSLWRDGTVTARRTEADEQAEAERIAAGQFFPCAPPGGACVTSLLTSKMQQYSVRLLDDEGAAERRAAALSVATARPSGQPPVAIAAPPQSIQPDRETGVRRALGWSLVAAGVLGVGGGIALWAYDKSGTDCHDVLGSDCRRTRTTETTAFIVTGVAAAAALAGGVLLVVDRTESGTTLRAALSVSPQGLLVGATF